MDAQNESCKNLVEALNPRTLNNIPKLCVWPRVERAARRGKVVVLLIFTTHRISKYDTNGMDFIILLLFMKADDIKKEKYSER